MRGGNRGASTLITKILVPLDGSAESERVAGWVAGLSRALGAEVVLLAVVNPQDHEPPGEQFPSPHPSLRGAAGEGPHDRLDGTLVVG